MIEAKIERELQGYVPDAQVDKLTFDDVWQLYNEVSGHPKLLEEMIQRQVVDVAKLRALALQDLEASLVNKPEPVTTTMKPSAPPMEEESAEQVLGGAKSSIQVHEGIIINNNSDNNGTHFFGRWPGLSNATAPRNIIVRIRTYGAFLQAFIGIPHQVLAAALRNDAEVLAMSFDQLINANVRDLLSGPSPLFSAELLRFKAIEYLSLRSPKFETFVNTYGRWLIDEHIIPASDFTLIFNRDCIEALDAVTLLDQWYEWPIKPHGHSLGLSNAALQLLMSLHKQLQVARDSFDTEAKRSKRQYTTEVNRLERRKKDALATATTPSTSSISPSASNDLGQVPIVHVNKNGSVKVTGTEQTLASSSSSSASGPSTERVVAEIDGEEMKLQNQLDLDTNRNKKSIETVAQAINDAWRNFLHPELLKSASPSPSNSVQVSLNINLLGGVNVSAGNH